MKLQVKSGVPSERRVPPRKTGASSKFEALLTMKKGDSVSLPTLADANAIKMLFSRNGMGTTMRKQIDGTYMVWRIF
jgi:hypothetical protein